MTYDAIDELEEKLHSAEWLLKEAKEEIEAQAKRITELENAFREIYEVYAGSDGFIPETCPEAYQQQLIKEMSDIAAKYMRKGKE